MKERKERNVTITLDKAIEWYKSGNATLKEIALQAFDKEELTAFDFTSIKTFEDACNTLSIDRKTANYLARVMDGISKASVAMFKLNIIRKALNLGQDLHLTKDPESSRIYYPYNPLATEGSTYFMDELNSGEIEVIGKIKNEGTLYNVFSGDPSYNYYYGLSDFNSEVGAASANTCIGFLGCVSPEIAQHFGKYFGMLITEAKYADMIDFEIIENKYQ